MEKLVCYYCGEEKKEVTFYIGASLEADWVMVEGTGRVTCPDCWERATKDGQEAIAKHTGL